MRDVGSHLGICRHDDAGCWTRLATFSSSPVTPNSEWNVTLLVVWLQGFSFHSDLTWRNVTLQPIRILQEGSFNPFTYFDGCETAYRGGYVSYFIDCETSSKESRNSLVN
jgi:hypothetical protein